jgi:hypothetical protein
MWAMKEEFSNDRNTEKNQIEILEKKSSMSQINSVESLFSRLDQMKTEYIGLKTR